MLESHGRSKRTAQKSACPGLALTPTQATCSSFTGVPEVTSRPPVPLFTANSVPQPRVGHGR